VLSLSFSLCIFIIRYFLSSCLAISFVLFFLYLFVCFWLHDTSTFLYREKNFVDIDFFDDQYVTYTQICCGDWKCHFILITRWNFSKFNWNRFWKTFSVVCLFINDILIIMERKRARIYLTYPGLVITSSSGRKKNKGLELLSTNFKGISFLSYWFTGISSSSSRLWWYNSFDSYLRINIRLCLWYLLQIFSSTHLSFILRTLLFQFNSD
jgi:hypothetical protein